MTKKLEELFGFDQLDDSTTPEPISETLTQEETQSAIISIDATIDKIDHALPAIRDLDASDKELDEIAELAKESFQNLSDLAVLSVSLDPKKDKVYKSLLPGIYTVKGTVPPNEITDKKILSESVQKLDDKKGPGQEI